MSYVVSQPLAEEVVGEFAVPGHPVQWWYVNALLDAPGTPLDGLALVGVFSLFEGVVEEGRHLLVSPDGGIFADFGTGPLRPGTIRADRHRLAVRNGANYLTGTFPSYELHLEGEATNGTHITATLSYQAQIQPEREGYVDAQLKHFVVYRAEATGTISLGDRAYPVRGVGYVEHLYGTLGWLEPYLGEANPPVFIDGWNWYWSPAAGPDGVAVQAGGTITEGRPLPFVSACADSKNFTHFTTGGFDVLESRAVEGVRYAHKFRIVDRTDEGAVDLTYTRRDAAQRAIKRAPGGAKVVFVTGFAEIEGTITLDGVTHDVSGPAFGSVFTVSLSPLMRRARELPSVIRVPLGRALRATQQTIAKVRP
jgi:hypothetical protein